MAVADHQANPTQEPQAQNDEFSALLRLGYKVRVISDVAITLSLDTKYCNVT